MRIGPSEPKRITFCARHFFKRLQIAYTKQFTAELMDVSGLWNLNDLFCNVVIVDKRTTIQLNISQNFIFNTYMIAPTSEYMRKSVFICTSNIHLLLPWRVTSCMQHTTIYGTT